MTDQSPLVLSLLLAVSGGQLVAHCPLQTLLPVPAASRSNVYSVMPLLPTSTPSVVLAGAELRLTLEQAEPTVAHARTQKEARIVMMNLVGSGWRCGLRARPQAHSAGATDGAESPPAGAASARRRP